MGQMGLPLTLRGKPCPEVHGPSERVAADVRHADRIEYTLGGRDAVFIHRRRPL
jgi:hypothetical protein